MKSKILIIDDEEVVIKAVKKHLDDREYEILSAGNSKEGLELFKKEHPILIILDLKMPAMDGVTFLRKIKLTLSASCAVIVLTGRGSDEEMEECFKMGISSFLKKPFNAVELKGVVRSAIALKRTEEKFRSTLEAILKGIKDGIVTIDKDLNVIEINEAFCTIWNCTREDVLNKPFSFLTKRLAISDCFDTIEVTIKEKQSVEMHNIKCRLQNNINKIVSIITFPLINQFGGFDGCVLVIKDETHIAAMEKVLKERHGFYKIIGKSKRMQEVYSLIENLSNVKTSVLITGESGTGKELVAEAIHYGGERGRRAIVKVNCSALSEHLLESELFGHVKGAFTGALTNKEGRFRKADGGTIFLDEIGDISPKIQLKLLRVLQEKEFEPVGDTTPVKVDIRIIAATNKELKKKVQAGEFRDDLFYRLKVVELVLPPLRERREDIPLLTEHFIRRFDHTLGKRITGISDDVLKIFMDYSWPGNVREFAHTIEHAFVVCNNEVITIDDLPLDLREFYHSNVYHRNDNKKLEKGKIIEALKETGWNKAGAARLLGVTRRTLYKKMEQYNIEANNE